MQPNLKNFGFCLVINIKSNVWPSENGTNRFHWATASNVRYIAYLLRGALKVSIYGKVWYQDVPPFCCLRYLSPSGSQWVQPTRHLRGACRRSCPHLWAPWGRLFFYFCECFFIVPQRKCFFAGNQIYSRGKCDTWPIFDVTLGRFLMWHLAVFLGLAGTSKR